MIQRPDSESMKLVDRPTSAKESVFFLGGHDLEMSEIARILRQRGVQLVDHNLNWTRAIFSEYESDIRAAVLEGKRPVLVELRDIPADMLAFVEIIDHHGPESGDRLTSLEQVLALIGSPSLTREQQLIAANDKGYIEGMAEIGATQEEIKRIRRMDREAQGITADQEAAAVTAIESRDDFIEGLTIICIPHEKSAAVTDRLSKLAGGPGYKTLLIESPHESEVFGDGELIKALHSGFGGYCGGQLPRKGYWGMTIHSESECLNVREFVVNFVQGLTG